MKAPTIKQKENEKIAKRLFKQVDFPVFSQAVQILFNQGTEKYGGDCLEMAKITSLALNALGLNTSVAIGECAWRISGKDDGGVISHSTKINGVTTIMPNAMKDRAIKHYHAWVALNQYWYADFSTYSFAQKIEALDAADGQHTTPTWLPDFILFNDAQIATFHQVQQGFTDKLAHYQQNTPAAIEAKQMADKENLDFSDDARTLLTIYQGLKSGNLQTVTHLNQPPAKG